MVRLRSLASLFPKKGSIVNQSSPVHKRHDKANLEIFSILSDKTRPSCLRCLKSGYTCKGYDLGLRMQSLVVVTEPEGSQRLARIVASTGGTTNTTPVSTQSHQQQQILTRPSTSTASLTSSSSPSSSSTSSSSSPSSSSSLSPPTTHQRTVKPKRRSQDDPAERAFRHAPPPEMNLTAFQEHMAFSYFFATYGWAYFWKPFLQLARENDFAPSASNMCSLALAYGHMGIGQGSNSLKSTGLELYGRSLREVQTLLTRGAEAREELARLCVPIVILGMYSVGCASFFLERVSSDTALTNGSAVRH